MSFCWILLWKHHRGPALGNCSFGEAVKFTEVDLFGQRDYPEQRFSGEKTKGLYLVAQDKEQGVCVKKPSGQFTPFPLVKLQISVLCLQPE